MTKKVLKILFFALCVLAVGQIRIDRAVIGEHFVSGVQQGSYWIAQKLATNPNIAKLAHPDFLNKWFPLGEKLAPNAKTNTNQPPSQAQTTTPAPSVASKPPSEDEEEELGVDPDQIPELSEENRAVLGGVGEPLE